MSCPFLQFVISCPSIGIVFPRLVSCSRNSVKKFLFQDVNLVESDIDQKKKLEETENEVAEDSNQDQVLDDNVGVDEPVFSEKNFVDDLPEPEVDEIEPSQENFEGDEVVKKIDTELSQLENKTADIVDVAKDADEYASQVSDDQDESTVINNYDGNNDSAYDTNEMNSRDGSNSRLQSANTNDEDVDNETGENYLLKLKNEIIETETERALLKTRAENSEILRLEHELENPPTPDDDADIVMSAENPLETGVGTASDDAKDEVL